MNAETDILCRAEILSIIYTGSKKNRRLSKTQIRYIHYLLNNPSIEDDDLDNLTRFNKINFFTLCNYDLNIKRLVFKGFAAYEVKRGNLYFRITEQGEHFIEMLKSSYFIRKFEILRDIFNSSIDETNLRKEVIPKVSIV